MLYLMIMQLCFSRAGAPDWDCEPGQMTFIHSVERYASMDACADATEERVAALIAWLHFNHAVPSVACVLETEAPEESTL